MEAHRKYLIDNFKLFLDGEINKEQLIKNLLKKFPRQSGNKKSYWWRFFKGDTGANSVRDLERYLKDDNRYYMGVQHNDIYYRELMSIAIENPLEIKIYFS